MTNCSSTWKKEICLGMEIVIESFYAEQMLTALSCHVPGPLALGAAALTTATASCNLFLFFNPAILSFSDVPLEEGEEEEAEDVGEAEEEEESSDDDDDGNQDEQQQQQDDIVLIDTDDEVNLRFLNIR